MNNIDKRKQLINATVKVMGTMGIDKTTTKNIASAAGRINEVYIYRNFENKEHLYHAAFISVTNNLNEKLLKLIPLLNSPGISNTDRWWLLISGFWKHILKNQDKCFCFLRYYYSPHFETLSSEKYKASYQVIIKALTPYFQENTNVELLYNYIVNTVLSFAAKAFYSENKNDIKTAQQVYEVIYFSIKPHLLQQQ